MTHIAKYLNQKLVLFLDTTTRDETLSQMVHALYIHGKVSDKKNFYQAIINREKVVSTGIGMGVAVPHAKLAKFNDFFIAIGILKTGVEWDSLDAAPVKIVFMIGGPDDKQTEYLQLLSNLTSIIKNEERRKRLISSKTSQEVIALLSEKDEALE